jgi:hypothetical protein
MFNYTSTSTECTPLLPRHEQLPSYSAIEASQLNQPERRNMPSNTSAPMGDNPTLPSSCEKLSPHAPHSESPVLQLPADTATAGRVRKFLHRLLRTKRGISTTEADEIVAQWADNGKGYQLRISPKPSFSLSLARTSVACSGTTWIRAWRVIRCARSAGPSMSA